MTPTITLYRSSAGSGKTRTLAKEYIQLALAGGGDSFRHILAVTFANKATQEMKERIVEYLADFAAGRPNNLSAELCQELGFTPAALQARSREVLSAILHKYSQFGISTIDAFFQRVIRSFTREAGLLGNFRLEVDNDLVLEEVVGALMDELGPEQPELTRWMVQFSKNELMEGKNWNIARALSAFAKEVLKEEFKQIEPFVMQADAARHQKNLEALQHEVWCFKSFMKGRAEKAMLEIQQHGFTIQDFWYGDKATAYLYFLKYASGLSHSSEGARLQSYLADSKNWVSKKSPQGGRLKKLAEESLLPILREMVAFEKGEGIRFRTAEAVIKNYYSFGLLADITRKLRDYKAENNVMLLADAPRFLNGIIQDSDTPFIYEKVGSWYRHYLIDEFQDTSRFQWQNFVPLLKEASDQQLRNLVVGDVKQSIYRWRGGDLRILQDEVVHEFGADRVDPRNLATNYRSAERIVHFNNMFFQAAADVVQNTVQDPLPKEVYRDVVQQAAKWPDKGYVHVRFINKEEGDWEQQALHALPAWLEKLQAQKIPLRDMAILVRKNSEGQQIANYLLQYQHSADAKPGFKYNVVSNESLRLDKAWSVSALISALYFLQNPDNKIARAQLAFELNRQRPASEVFSNAQRNQLEGLLPAEFILQARFLTKLSMFELTEELIRLFELGTRHEELAYLQAFQDLVLEFSAREKTDLTAFLTWWEVNKEKKSIQVSGSMDAVSILTLHKAKGLQFKYVIIPFCSWKLNHERSPILWATAADPAFVGLGPVAVVYKSDLANTFFKDDYLQERTKTYLDSLNMLYVAFTRAEAGLIAMAPEPTRQDMNTVAHVAHHVIQQQPELAPFWNGTQLEIGELEKLETDTRATAEPVHLQNYWSCDWRKKLVIKRQGREFFDEAVSTKRTKINAGILLHQVLARLHHATDWPRIRDVFFQENPVPDEIQTQLNEQVDVLLKHPLAAAWFTKGWHVQTEVSILLPGGRSLRLDRWLTQRSKNVLIDYKTGDKKAADRAQMAEYVTVLRQMGLTDVKTYLVYLQPLEIEPVTGATTLNLFE